MADVPQPVPVADASSAGFWLAAAARRLAIQRCRHCGRFAHPPVVICPRCQSRAAEFDFEVLSGKGTLRTWTVMRDSFLPGFQREIPWAIGEAELDGTEGVRLVARMADGPDAAYAIGAHVETVFREIDDGLSLPLFRLVTS